MLSLKDGFWDALRVVICSIMIDVRDVEATTRSGIRVDLEGGGGGMRSWTGAREVWPRGMAMPMVESGGRTGEFGARFVVEGVYLFQAKA